MNGLPQIQVTLTDFGYPVQVLWLTCSEDIYIIWLCKLLIINAREKSYSRNASCEINSTSTFLLEIAIIIFIFPFVMLRKRLIDINMLYKFQNIHILSQIFFIKIFIKAQKTSRTIINLTCEMPNQNKVISEMCIVLYCFYKGET